MRLELTDSDDEDFCISFGDRTILLETDQFKKYPFQINLDRGEENTRFLSNKEVLQLTQFLMVYCAEKNLLDIDK